jgi:hypothetical protein
MTSLLPGNTLLLPMPTGVFPSTILALQDHWMLVEVQPPDGSPTSLLLFKRSSWLSQPDQCLARELSYWELPLFCLRAISEAGTSWVGRPKELDASRPSLPSPATLLRQRAFCLTLLPFLQQGTGASLLAALCRQYPWIKGWSNGACLILAEALCLWISTPQPSALNPTVRMRLRVLVYPPSEPFHVVASLSLAQEEWLIDAHGIWTPPSLLLRHTRDVPPVLLEALPELLTNISQDAACSRELATHLQATFGPFPLHLFFPVEQHILPSLAS